MSVVRINRLILEKIYEVFVGANETVLNIRVSVLSGCPKSGVPLYFSLCIKFPRTSEVLYMESRKESLLFLL